MRKFSNASVAMIVAIALYFTLSWGLEGVRVFTSPSYGLDEVWRSQTIFVIGRVFGLDPVGLIKLAAFFGAVKFAVAAICALHILDRVHSFGGGKANAEILEGALILVVLISIVSAGPAAWAGNGEVVREQTIQLVLAALATALCMVERSYAETEIKAADEDDTVEATIPPGARWFSPWR
jgi:hypothetical protein